MEQLSRLNRIVYRAERTFVAVALLVMALVVFFDVAHRSFSGERSKGIESFIKVIGWFGPDLTEGQPGHASALQILPWIAFVLASALGWAAVRASTRGSMGHAKAAGLGALGTAALYGMVQLLVRLLPNGLIWSQPLALILTLWVGFVGASMATYEHKHLKVEAVVRHVPPHLRKYVGLLSATLTALFCFALMWVSIRYVRFSYDEWRETGGQGGVFVGLEVPKYLAFMALPLTFGVMSARFLGVGVLAYQGKLAEDDPLAGLVDEATKQAFAVAVAPPPSDVPTEAVRPIRDVPEVPVSEKRPAAAVGDIVTNRPSDVVTDRHATPEETPTVSDVDEPEPDERSSDDEGGAR